MAATEDTLSETKRPDIEDVRITAENMSFFGHTKWADTVYGLLTYIAAQDAEIERLQAENAKLRDDHPAWILDSAGNVRLASALDGDK